MCECRRVDNINCSCESSPNNILINGQLAKIPANGTNNLTYLANPTNSALVSVGSSPTPDVQLVAASGSIIMSSPLVSMPSIPNTIKTNVLYYDNLTSLVSWGAVSLPTMSGFYVNLTAPIVLSTSNIVINFSGSVMATNGPHSYNTGIFDPVSGYITPTLTAKYHIECSFTVQTVNFSGNRSFTLQFRENLPSFALIAAASKTAFTSSAIGIHTEYVNVSTTCILDAGANYQVVLSIGPMTGAMTSANCLQLHYSYISCRQLV